MLPVGDPLEMYMAQNVQESSYAGLYVFLIMGSLCGIYYVLAVFAGLSHWICGLVDFAVFVTCFITWVRHENAKIRAEEEQTVAAAKAAAAEKTKAKPEEKPDKKKD